eukprot:gene4958-6931_t
MRFSRYKRIFKREFYGRKAQTTKKSEEEEEEEEELSIAGSCSAPSSLAWHYVWHFSISGELFDENERQQTATISIVFGCRKEIFIKISKLVTTPSTKLVFGFGYILMVLSNSVIFAILIFTLRSIKIYSQITVHWTKNITEQFIFNTFPTKTIQNSPALFSNIVNYIVQHNSDTVLIQDSNNICNRDYIVAVYACPQAVGNRMHEFTNSLIGAYLLNKTVVYKFCDRKPCKWDNEGDCNEFFTRHSWILSYETLVNKWNSLRCSELTNSSTDLEILIIPQFRYQTSKILTCCGIEQFPSVGRTPFMIFGTFELHEMYALTVPSARISKNLKTRVNELFHLGEDFGYGVMFLISFEFKSFIIHENNKLLSLHEGEILQHNRIRIGLHLRHSGLLNLNDMKTIFFSATSCVNELFVLKQPFMNNKTINNFNNNSIPCSILLSTDRSEILEYATSLKLLSNYNCTVIVSNHSKTRIPGLINEHGLFAGHIAINDLELISRSDFFIGSTYVTPTHLRNYASSFSLLIAELKAVKNSNNYDFVPASYHNYKPWYMPRCVEALGGQIFPDELYDRNKPPFECGNNEEKKIMLHLKCPYWNKTKLS